MNFSAIDQRRANVLEMCTRHVYHMCWSCAIRFIERENFETTEKGKVQFCIMEFFRI